MTQETVKNETKRNYQLDFLKLIFTCFVYLLHASVFFGENTRITLPPMFGSVSVFFFFVVSGMLMANSTARQTEAAPGKTAITFVLKKFKAIIPTIWVALFLYFVVNIFFIYGDFKNVLKNLFRIFPETFLLNQSGVTIGFLTQTWYLSAMFICMIPLAYLLFRNRDFTLYIFAPLTAVLTLGYMCQKNNYLFSSYTYFDTTVMGGIIFALSGLCFGIVSWTIYDQIKRNIYIYIYRIILTATEVLIWLFYFGAWFFIKDRMAIMSVQLLVPINIAICFSGKSYIGELFRFKWMRFFAPLSLSIYINHWIGRKLTEYLFMGNSFKFCLLWMSVFTLAACLLNWVILKLCKTLWDRKFKKLFAKREASDT